MLAVDIQGVTHRYGDHTALRDVTFGVEPGVRFGLLGPNGGGKTTLFRILTTLMRPSEGSARVFGHDAAAEAGAVRQRLGVVFQHAALDDELTVRENLRFHGALYGLRGPALRRRIDHLLALFDLDARADARIRTLSGGLVRRVDLARGLLHTPSLLLLDEPTTGLDPVARRSFWQLLERLRRDEGTTMLVATHLMEEAERCDAVGILDRGRLVALGPPDALKRGLGEETLWIETTDPLGLRDRIHAHLGVEAAVIDRSLQITHPDAPALLATLYQTFEGQIDSATVRRPTLEDVFLMHAGHRLTEPDSVSGLEFRV